MADDAIMDFGSKHPLRSIADVLRTAQLIDGESLASQVFALLWELIVTIQLRPGQQVSEKEISEALKASKTPVREALIRLEDAGMVLVVPKSGTYVTPIRIDRYFEACFTRLQLEIGAVRRAATRNHDTAALVALEAIITRQVEAHDAEDYERFFHLDERLHKAFFDMAGVPGVYGVVRKTQADVYRIRHLKRIYNIRNGQRVIDQHREIVAAIRAGSSAEAEAALVRHIGTLEKEIDALAARPELLDYIEALNAAPTRARGSRRA